MIAFLHRRPSFERRPEAARPVSLSLVLGLQMELKTPPDIVALQELGKWSRSSSGLVHLGESAAHRLSEDDSELVLMLPPFHTIADEIARGNSFWNGLTNVGQIDYNRALIIADFGPGSDSPVVLYYGGSTEPSVMYLRWTFSPRVDHEWVETHTNFAAFAIDIGLVEPSE